MSIPHTRALLRRPVHPGEMLREDFLPEYGLTVASLATAVGVSRQSVNELVAERRAVSPAMAIRLGRLFGNSPEFWLNAQRAVDLWDASQKLKGDVSRIKPLRVAERTLKQSSECGSSLLDWGVMQWSRSARKHALTGLSQLAVSPNWTGHFGKCRFAFQREFLQWKRIGVVRMVGGALAPTSRGSS